MKQSRWVRSVGALIFCLVAAGLGAPVQAVPNGRAALAAESDNGDVPPGYVLVLAGLSAVLFISGRRRR